MREEDIKELYLLITDFAIKKEYKNNHLIEFFIYCLLGTMHTSCFSQEYLDDVLDHMKIVYKIMIENKNELS